MVQKTLALCAAALILVGAAFASPDKDKKKKPVKPAAAAKLILITTCPITKEDAKAAAGGSEVVGKYKVNFCCAGCKPNFDKMTKEEKEKTLAALAKKQDSTKKG